MKKFLSVILGILFTILLIGCDDSSTKYDNSSVTDTVIVDKIYKSEAKEQTATAEKLPETEILSAEDKAVKTEIAKYVDTDVDFRKIKKEKIQEKEIDISFSKVEKIGEEEKVFYENSSGDEFMYNADNGKLFLARINSVVTEKSTQSIDINSAQKIAIQYATDKCNISEYTLDYTSEDSSGYVFGFSKYIFGYDTDASIEIGVGFDGAIVYIRDNTDIFDGMDMNITADWIDTKAQEKLAEFETGTAEIRNIYISVNEEEPCLIVSIAYGTKTDGSIGASVGAFIIPFE